MIKIVYFDNSSAIDYLNIYNGGEQIQTKEEQIDKAQQLTTQATAAITAKLSWLNFFTAKAEANVDAEINSKDNSIVKTTLSNTVLTDFLQQAESDDKVFKFDSYKLRAYKNSIAYFKMFTPYLKMTSSDLESDGVRFDISKIDDAFISGKGYYELIAEKNEDGKIKKHIFRFNIGAFRNNYTIADLTKMELKYLAVKVGSTYEYNLDISKEIDLEQSTLTSAFDMLDDTNNDELDVFDVILAGVSV